MATTDLNREYLKLAIEDKIKQVRRAINTQPNPLIKELLEKDLAAYTSGLATIKEK